MFITPDPNEIKRIAESVDAMLARATTIVKRYRSTRIASRRVAYCPTTGKFRTLRSTSEPRRNEIIFVDAADWIAALAWRCRAKRPRRKERRSVSDWLGRKLCEKLAGLLTERETVKGALKAASWRGVERATEVANAEGLTYKNGLIVKRMGRVNG
jgi:hypothetical protein